MLNVSALLFCTSPAWSECILRRQSHPLFYSVWAPVLQSKILTFYSSDSRGSLPLFLMELKYSLCTLKKSSCVWVLFFLFRFLTFNNFSLKKVRLFEIIKLKNYHWYVSPLISDTQLSKVYYQCWTSENDISSPVWKNWWVYKAGTLPVPDWLLFYVSDKSLNYHFQICFWRANCQRTNILHFLKPILMLISSINLLTKMITNPIISYPTNILLIKEK